MLQELKLEGLTKQVGFTNIVADIHLTVKAGELIAITGPNGAGKTTLLRMLAGISRKSAGEIYWDQERFTPQRTDLLQRIGLIGHHPMVYESLTALENLRFFARMYEVREPSPIDVMLRKVGLQYDQHGFVRHFSRGMKQRLAIARMLLHDPELLLYDEPFTGLDAEGQDLLLQIVREMQEAGKIQFVITHHPEELDIITFRELRLRWGQMVGGGSEG